MSSRHPEDFQPPAAAGRELGVLQPGEVRLQVPATPEFFRMVRVITSAVANTRGFALDGLEDLRIAVHELCGALIGAGRPGTVDLRFLMLPDGLLVEGMGHFDDEDGAETVLSDLSRQILSVVVDGFEFAGPGFQMVKNLDNHRPISSTSPSGI